MATRLLSLLGKPGVNLRDVSNIITTDAAFSTEVLRLANSSRWGIGAEVSNLLHAISLLGVERVSSLAITVALRNFAGKAGKMEHLQAIWRHNLAVAILAEELSSLLDVEPAVAYTAGLLHDVGRLALLAGHASKYEELLKEELENPGHLNQREKEVFGRDHCEIGAEICKQGSFPEDLRQCVEHHHNALHLHKDERLNMAGVVRLSCALADSLGFCVLNYKEAPSCEEHLLGLSQWDQERLARDWQQMEFQVALRVNAMDLNL